jgi:hypothetical protein
LGAVVWGVSCFASKLDAKQLKNITALGKDIT